MGRSHDIAAGSHSSRDFPVANNAAADPRALPRHARAISGPPPGYECQVLETNPTGELLSGAELCAQRADAENVCDELKKHRGLGGFTTKDPLRCRAANHTAAEKHA